VAHIDLYACLPAGRHCFNLAPKICYYKYMDYLTYKVIATAVIAVTIFVYWLFNFTVIYHLARFGVGTQPKKIAFIFFLGSIGLFFASVFLFARTDFNIVKEKLVQIGSNSFNLSGLNQNR